LLGLPNSGDEDITICSGCSELLVHRHGVMTRKPAVFSNTNGRGAIQEFLTPYSGCKTRHLFNKIPVPTLNTISSLSHYHLPTFW